MSHARRKHDMGMAESSSGSLFMQVGHTNDNIITHRHSYSAACCMQAPIGEYWDNTSLLYNIAHINV